MLSKPQSKYIRSLAMPKFRQMHKTFIVEGDKMAKEWLKHPHLIEQILALPTWLEQNKSLIKNLTDGQIITPVFEDELKSISQLKTPNQVLVVAKMRVLPEAILLKKKAIILDDLQDPGNMGSILRIADWFG